ncbi:unnamed protein product [Lampetra fluviatilis]
MGGLLRMRSHTLRTNFSSLQRRLAIRGRELACGRGNVPRVRWPLENSAAHTAPRARVQAHLTDQHGLAAANGRERERESDTHKERDKERERDREAQVFQTSLSTRGAKHRTVTSEPHAVASQNEHAAALPQPASLFLNDGCTARGTFQHHQRKDLSTAKRRAGTALPISSGIRSGNNSPPEQVGRAPIAIFTTPQQQQRLLRSGRPRRIYGRGQLVPNYFKRLQVERRARAERELNPRPPRRLNHNHQHQQHRQQPPRLEPQTPPPLPPPPTFRLFVKSNSGNC